MRSAWFGWGVPQLKRHWSLRWGECPSCGCADFRPSYEASRMVVILGMPVWPVGKVHVHEACEACGRPGGEYGLGEWEALREERFLPALEAFSTRPLEAETASEAMRQTVAYGELEEFRQLAALVEERFAGDAEVLSQLGWCQAHFARFEEARRLLRRAAELESDNEERRAVVEAYGRVPGKAPPRPPSRVFQGLRCVPWPLIMVVAAAWGLAMVISLTAGRGVADVYVVNGLDRAYEVLLNGEITVSLEAHERERLAMPPGPVRVSPVAGSLPFEPYSFTLPEDSRNRPVTAVINPDRLAVITWEELVYRNTEAGEERANEDQFVLQAGEGYYLFDSITDAFADPPAALELHSRDEETYRHVLHHLAEETPLSLVTLLLGQGEMDLARDYARNVLRMRPDETALLPILVELAPNQQTLAFLEERLEDRPVRYHWHRQHLDLGLALGKRPELEERYGRLKVEEPDNGDFRYFLGRTRAEASLAEEDFRDAADLGSPDALYALSMRSSAMGDFSTALEQVRTALAGRPGTSAFQEQEEDVLLALGRYEELTERYRARLEKDPLDQRAALTLAGLHEAQGKGEAAESVTGRFLQAVQVDRAVGAEETAPLKRLFAGVRAQWAGDPAAFLARDAGGEESGDFTALLLREDYPAAAAAMDAANKNPFLHLLLYGLARTEEAHAALAEAQLSQALALFKDEGSPVSRITSWFRQGASPPALEETLRVPLPNYHRRVLLFALARRYPEAAQSYLELAAKLNYPRVFPYLALKQALAEEVNP